MQTQRNRKPVYCHIYHRDDGNESLDDLWNYSVGLAFDLLERCAVHGCFIYNIQNLQRQRDTE